MPAIFIPSASSPPFVLVLLNNYHRGPDETLHFEGSIATSTNMAYEMTAVGGDTTGSPEYSIVGESRESAPVISNGDEDQYEVPSVPSILDAVKSGKKYENIFR